MRICAGHEGHTCEVDLTGAHPNTRRCPTCRHALKNERERGYHARNAAAINLRKKEWYERNREKKLAKNREWREANADRMVEINREWYIANPDKARARCNRRRARIAGAFDDGTWPTDPPQAKCQHCGSTERLEMDHIVPLSNGGDHTLANCQALCRTCNREKGNRYTG